MVEVKDKIVTAESLSALHEHNKKTFMPMTDPTGSGTMKMNGSANFTGNVNVGSITIGSSVKLVPNMDRIEIVFLDSGTTEEG